MRDSHLNAMRSAVRSALVTLVAAATILTFGVSATVNSGIRLLANTLLVMGGNTNPAGLTPKMQQQLGGDPWYPDPNTDKLKPVGVFGQGYIDAQNNPGSPYFGWDFNLVDWPAQIGLKIKGEWTYEESQQQGVHNIDWAIRDVLPTLAPGETALAFGYSSSANVMVREMRALQNQPGGAPATGQLDFFLMGNPNRPNGGIMARFPGVYVPLLDVRVDGSTPVDTPYPTTDISWEYDAASDFPNYPINLLAVLNSLVSGSYLHGNYYPAKVVTGPRALPDTTVGNITYITLTPPHLPLLMPLYYWGFPKPLLDLVEPALTVMVDWGYNRSISPGTPATARLIPRVNPITATVDLVAAIGKGVRDFCDDLKPAGRASQAPAAPAATSIKAPAVAVSRANRQVAPARASAATRHPAQMRPRAMGAARTAKPAASVTRPATSRS
jgi:hypothetical protein